MAHRVVDTRKSCHQSSQSQSGGKYKSYATSIRSMVMVTAQNTMKVSSSRVSMSFWLRAVTNFLTLASRKFLHIRAHRRVRNGCLSIPIRVPVRVIIARRE